MSELIKELVDYQKNGSAGPLLNQIEKKIGPKDLRLVTIKLLSWLKVEHSRKASKPLVLGSFPWCDVLHSLLEDYPTFSDIFEISGNDFTYNQGLSANQIDLMTEIAVSGYNPPLMK